jgi:dynein light intermediate chain 1, cytosolic
LLHKKSGSPGGPSGPNSLTSPRQNGNDGMTTPDKLTMRTDAAAELDRLTRGVKKEMDFSTPSSDC